MAQCIILVIIVNLAQNLRHTLTSTGSSGIFGPAVETCQYTVATEIG